MALFRKALVVGGAAVAAVAFLKRDRVAGLLPSRAGAPQPPAAPPPPAPSNYDAPGPPANTATPVPAPEPQVRPAGIDEAAEEAAAAAEAASIGGAPTHYAGPAGEPASEAERPLAEAGQGESEGLEQAEAELVENTVVRDAGMTDAERQLEDEMERQYSPLAGETVEPVVSGEPAEVVAGKAPAEIVQEGPLSVSTPHASGDEEHPDDDEDAAPAALDGPQPRAYSASAPPTAPGAADDEEHEPSTFHERATETDTPEPRTYSGSEPPEYVEHPEPHDDEHEPHDPDAATYAPPAPHAYDAPPTEPVPAGAATATATATSAGPEAGLAAAGDEPAGIAAGEALLEPAEAAAAAPDQDATGAEPEDKWETWTGPKVQPPPKE